MRRMMKYVKTRRRIATQPGEIMKGFFFSSMWTSSVRAGIPNRPHDKRLLKDYHECVKISFPKGPTVPTQYWHSLEDGRIQCDVCPRACRLHDGQRGMCFVRAAE